MSLRVLRAAGPAWLQDGGRPGHEALGVPRGGALCRARWARCNRAVGNPMNSVALELFGTFALEAESPCVVALDEERRVLRAGESLLVEPAPSARVRYLSVRGGFRAPLQLGGRGSLAAGGLGARGGAPLARGDVLESEVPAGPPLPPLEQGLFEALWSDLDAAPLLRASRGPDSELFAPRLGVPGEELAVQISRASDRLGTRLVDPSRRLASAARLPSQPMLAGAIEATPSGELLALGPDHPTAGGYPLWAVLVEADLDRLGSLAPGTEVKLRLVPQAEAEALDARWAALWSAEELRERERLRP